MQGMVDKLSIAFDGPAGAGKSTVARLVAEQLGYQYVNTGAMYRAFALKVAEARTDSSIPPEICALLQTTSIDLKGDQVYLDGIDVSEKIRSTTIGALASDISTLPEVREQMVRWQREMAKDKGVVMDGRDIGTVVLPDADVKVFLTASLEERTRRRFEEMRAKGLEVNWDDVEAEIIKRDEQDSSRAVGPLKPAPDAVILDSTDLNISEVVGRVIDLCKRRLESCSTE